MVCLIETPPENRMSYTCPCCGYKTLAEEPPGTYEICPICDWEDDVVQFDDPDYEGCANRLSLRQNQQKFMRKDANGERYRTSHYIFEKDTCWRPLP
jgi:anaerobic ribonucleoside-triphosphate reductase